MLNEHKMLGGDRTRTANLNCPKGCPVQYGITICWNTLKLGSRLRGQPLPRGKMGISQRVVSKCAVHHLLYEYAWGLLLKQCHLLWPVTSEADVGVMAVEAEPSHQYSITLCCCMTDGSREVLQTGWCLTWKCIESKGVSLNSFMWEKKWHSLTFINTCSNVYGDQTVDVSTVRWWVVCFSSGENVTSTCSDFNEHSMQAFVVKIHSYSWWLC